MMIFLFLLWQTPFVPESFQIPTQWEQPGFVLEPINSEHAALDFDAVMASKTMLHKLFGPHWPDEAFTVDKNREQLRFHEVDFQKRRGFTYSVFTAQKDKIVGCVYLYPHESEASVVTVTYWLRPDQTLKVPVFVAALKHWIKNQWPFEKVTYLGPTL